MYLDNNNHHFFNTTFTFSICLFLFQEGGGKGQMFGLKNILGEYKKYEGKNPRLNDNY